MPAPCYRQTQCKPAGSSKQRRASQLKPLNPPVGPVFLCVAQNFRSVLTSASTAENRHSLLVEGLRKHVDQMQLVQLVAGVYHRSKVTS